MDSRQTRRSPSNRTQPQELSPSAVNVYATYDSMGNPTLNPQPGANDIFIDQNQFQTGDVVTYQFPQGDTSPIGGLINNQTYQVTQYLTDPNDPNDPNLIQLSDLQTVSSVTFMPEMSGGDIIERNDGGSWAANGFMAGQQITVSGSQNNNGTYTIQSLSGNQLVLTVSMKLTQETASNVTFVGPVVALSPVSGSTVPATLTELPISPLQSGDTYDVTNVTSANTFQLASSLPECDEWNRDHAPDGGAWFQHGVPVRAAGHRYLAVVGESIACHRDRRHTELPTKHAANPRSRRCAPLRRLTDYRQWSIVRHVNRLGGGLRGCRHQLVKRDRCTGGCRIRERTNVTAAGNVTITSNSTTNQSAFTNNGTGGFVAVGTTNATTQQNNNGNDASSHAYVGSGSTIVAGGNFILSSNSSSGTSVSASSSAGGFASSVDSNTTGDIDYNTTSTVNSAATVTAGNLLEVTAIRASTPIPSRTRTVKGSAGAAMPTPATDRASTSAPTAAQALSPRSAQGRA